MLASSFYGLIYYCLIIAYSSYIEKKYLLYGSWYKTILLIIQNITDTSKLIFITQVRKLN